jgi:23S rRNA pseudouridine2605 synthase
VKTQKVCGLARALSKMGYCSRSRAALLIQAKRVSVNGRIAQDVEIPVRIGQDRIVVDGLPVEKRAAIYLVMNKPRGVLTTASDEKGRETVYSLLAPDTPWVGPVGRLDKASEGLLLLTNDSEWAARVTDPASHLDKVYHVQVDRVADADLLVKIRKGCTVEGEHLRAKGARLLRSGDKNCWLEITLDEGKNRQIRRLLEMLEVRVLRLVRTAIGPLGLGELKKGAVRALAAKEKRAMDQVVNRG